MDDPQATPDDAERETPPAASDDTAAGEPMLSDSASAGAEPPPEPIPETVPEPAEDNVSEPVAETPPESESASAAPQRKPSRYDDFDDEEYEPPVKSEPFARADASGRPALPSHNNEDDTPRDPSTIPLHWYVLKVQSNREKSIRDSLVRRIKREGVEDYFGEIVIPTEKVVETKGGKRKIREQKLFPGYMMIQCRLTDETWFLVRDTSGVGDFTGAAGRPIPMQEHEIQRMLGEPQAPGEEEKPHRPVVRFSVQVGDVVKVKEGAFESFEGSVDSLDETSGKVKVIIEIFGRPTEVELEHWQVEKA